MQNQELLNFMKSHRNSNEILSHSEHIIENAIEKDNSTFEKAGKLKDNLL
jgi:hypothetical protein